MLLILPIMLYSYSTNLTNYSLWLCLKMPHYSPIMLFLLNTIKLYCNMIGCFNWTLLNFNESYIATWLLSLHSLPSCFADCHSQFTNQFSFQVSTQHWQQHTTHINFTYYAPILPIMLWLCSFQHYAQMKPIVPKEYAAYFTQAYSTGRSFVTLLELVQYITPKRDVGTLHC